jgi:hypothetical protein
MEDIEESKKLKARINDASSNKEIFELKARVISARIRTLKHEAAIKICGPAPKIPSGMDTLTFSLIIDHIYEHTEAALVGDTKSAEGKAMLKHIAEVKKINPVLKKYTASAKKVV